jgi:two-component system, OmpR family, sensor kinase
MDTDSKFKTHIFGKKAKIISKLRDFVYLAEKNTPLDIASYEPFPDDELGRLLNRMVAVYNRYAKEQTFLTKAQERAIMEKQEQIRNKKQLTQNISHELKTPVSSIQGYLETIINNPKLSKQQIMDFVIKSHEQSKRLSLLLQDLSTITRMDEASEMIEKDDISLSEIIDEAVKSKTSEAQEKGIVIHNNTPEGLNMFGNESLIRSIFTNLLNNAIQYSRGTEITIVLQDKTNDFYVFSFSDNGVGIDEIHLSRIFERFYRIDKGRSRLLGGTGLGLSIVKNAILIHGGAIEARNHDGKGLEFVFSLAKKS